MDTKKKTTIQSEKVRMYNPVIGSYYLIRRANSLPKRGGETIVEGWAKRRMK